MPASHTNGHRFVAAPQSHGPAASPVSQQFPTGRIGISKARKSLTTFEPRKARCLTDFDAPEKGLESQIETAQGLLEGMAAEFDELGARRFDLRQSVLL